MIFLIWNMIGGSELNYILKFNLCNLLLCILGLNIIPPSNKNEKLKYLE